MLKFVYRHIIIYIYSTPVPKTCHIYHVKGATESGNYIIDPDGPGNAAPFTAYCDFATGNLLEQMESLKLHTIRCFCKCTSNKLCSYF